jgi:hypothetical protein
MSSTDRTSVAAAFALLGVVGLAYSTLLARLLLGAGFAAAAFLVAVLVYYGDTDRRTLVRATMAVTIVYGVVTLQLPMAVIAACVVYPRGSQAPTAPSIRSIRPSSRHRDRGPTGRKTPTEFGPDETGPTAGLTRPAT